MDKPNYSCLLQSVVDEDYRLPFELVSRVSREIIEASLELLP
jgi:hypothetical protein